MFHNRLLVLLGGCFLAASAAWAGDVGYIDCSTQSSQEDTQVFAKARKSPDVVASLPCGERFTILVYGFIFTRIQTRDGKVGYVYSNLVAVDRTANPVLQPASVRTPVYRQSAPETAATVAQPQPAPAQPVSAQPASAQPVPTQPAVRISSAPETTATVVQPDPPAPAQPQPAPAQPAPTQPAVPASSAPETTATVVQPDPSAAAQPQPTSAQPAPAQPAPAEAAAPAIQPADSSTGWERPHPGARTAPLMEVYGGYAFARLVSGGTGSNLNGVLGSFGYNIRPWLQLVADSSYSFVTTNGTKNVLYGNHYGPRFFRRGRNRWGATPFAEALVGGSRADTIVSGVGGYTISENCFSIKAGGGIDIHPSRRLDIRLFDVDYYRTSFGTNLHQNNYWVSTGIVLRLFGGGSE
jgi:outer membrane biosynthesis protein TonB